MADAPWLRALDAIATHALALGLEIMAPSVPKQRAAEVNAHVHAPFVFNVDSLSDLTVEQLEAALEASKWRGKFQARLDAGDVDHEAYLLYLRKVVI